MTMDEAFDALHAMRYVDRDDFEAGYRAGQEAMRERAADVAVQCDHNCPRGIVSIIRALPVEESK